MVTSYTSELGTDLSNPPTLIPGFDGYDDIQDFLDNLSSQELDMTTAYTVKLVPENDYHVDKRIAVEVPLSPISKDICGGPTGKVVSGIRISPDIYWGTPSGV